MMRGQRACYSWWTRGRPGRSLILSDTTKGSCTGQRCSAYILRSGLNRFREGEGEEAFAYYMNDIYLSLMGVAANVVEVIITIPRRELNEIVVLTNAVKTVALPLPTSPLPDGRKAFLLEIFGVRIAEEGRVLLVVGVPVGTEEYVVKSALGGSLGRRRGPPGALPR